MVVEEATSSNGVEITAQRIVAKLKTHLAREASIRKRLGELKAARIEHIALSLLPAERAYREAERVDFGFAVGIAELEQALREEEKATAPLA